MESQDPPLSGKRAADLRFVTAHFEALQGLAIMPALVFMAGFFAFAVWAGDRFAGSPLWLIGFGVGFAIALLLSAVVARWYRRKYGEIAPSRTGRAIPQFVGVVALIVLLAVARAIPVAAISLEGLVIAAALCVLGWRLRAAFGVVLFPAAAVVAAAALLPFGDWLGLPAHPLSNTEVLLTVICLAWIAAAIRSHLVLARALRPEQ